MEGGCGDRHDVADSFLHHRLPIPHHRRARAVSSHERGHRRDSWQVPARWREAVEIVMTSPTPSCTTGCPSPTTGAPERYLPTNGATAETRGRCPPDGGRLWRSS